MRRVMFWLRWSWRDLQDRRFLVIAIALTIGLGTGSYAALDSMSTWRTDANVRSLALLRAHDVRVYLASGSYATPAQLTGLVAAIPHASSVVATQARLVLPARVEAFPDGAATAATGGVAAIGGTEASGGASSAGRSPVIVPGRLVGMATGEPDVDALQVRGGRGLVGADAGTPAALLEDHFATHYGVPLPSSIEVGGQRLEAVGRAMASDYLMVIGESGDIMGEANFGVVFTSLETAQALVARPGLANELVLRLDDPSLAPTVRDELVTAGAAALPDLGVGAIAGEDEDARRMVVRDVEGDASFFGLFAALLLGGAALAAFNLTTRIVEAQRRQIGIGLALGLPARTLAIRPLAVAAEIALIGVVLGVGVGLLMGAGLRAVLVEMIPMPVFDAPFQVGIFARAAAIGFVLPFVASVYPVWRAVRARPVDAIRTGYLAARQPGLVRFANRLPLPRVMRMPVSNVLRTPRRTLLTALGVGAGVTVMIGTIGMLDTMSAGIDLGEREIVGGSRDRLAISVDSPVPATFARSALASVPGSGRVDLGLRLPATAQTAGHGSIALAVDVLDLRDNAWTPTLAEGRLPSGPGEIMLSRQAASDLGMRLGDAVQITHPRLVSATAVAMVETDLILVGIHPSPMRPQAYVDASGASLFAMDGLANRATVVPAAGTDPASLRLALFELPGVVSVQPIDALATSLRDLLAQFVDILGIAALIAVALSILVAYNSATISQDERTREIATMLAFGVPARRVLVSAMLESGLIGVVGTILGIGGGFAALFWLVKGVMPATVPDFGLEPAIASSTLLLAIGLGVAAVALAPVLTARRLRTMDLPATLRIVE